MKPKITKTTNIAKLISKHPKLSEVFVDYGLHCVGCFASEFDTIEAGSKVHGLSDQEIGEMVDRLNEVLETEK